ncbi:MAG TPA: SMP-30/gluconolactonase/LRE family protein [Acidimicrobiia bacterium]|jgi:sugar lactone lactonase YvrE
MNQPQVLVDGIAFGESVRWRDGRVWYCDWIDGTVCSVSPDGLDPTTHAKVNGLPICIDWTDKGELLIVDGSKGEVLKQADSGALSQLADLSSVSDRPWNEVAAHPSGRIYLNGIGFDMMGGEPPSGGLIAVLEADGSVRQVVDDLEFPNGMIITQDGSTLIVAESYAGRLTAFTITADGVLIDRRVFAAVDESAPDGISFTKNEDAVWYADVPNRHCRLVREGGEVLKTIEVDRGCFSCAIGEDDRLYIAATVWDDQTFASRRGRLLASDQLP